MNQETFRRIIKQDSGTESTLLVALDVSRELNLPLTTVYLYSRQGVIPSIRIGNKIRFKKSDILKLKSGKK